jgi:hypothetical protein
MDTCRDFIGGRRIAAVASIWTSADMGNSPTIVFKNYRELVVPEEAERYFNLFPPAPAENIVELAAVA